jgi:hypothetical protein
MGQILGALHLYLITLLFKLLIGEPHHLSDARRHVFASK